MVVAAALVSRAAQRAAPVPRRAEPHRGEVQAVLVVGRHGEAHIVGRPLGHGVVAADEPPAVAAVVAAIQRGILILDQGVHGVRVARGDGDGDLAHRVLRIGEAVTHQAFPGDAAVARGPQAAARAAALQMPRLHVELPHPGEQGLGVAGIDGEVGAPGVRVHEQHPGPAAAPIAGAEHAAGRRGAVAAPERAHQHDVGVGGVDHDAGDASGRVEAHMLPAAPAVRRAVHAVPERRGRANEEGLARAGPQRGVCRGRERQGADRLHRLAIEAGPPVHAAILRPPHPARRGADVRHEGVARLADDRHGAVALGADEAVAQVRPQGGVRLLGGRRGGAEREEGDDATGAGHGGQGLGCERRTRG